MCFEIMFLLLLRLSYFNRQMKVSRHHYSSFDLVSTAWVFFVGTINLVLGI